MSHRYQLEASHVFNTRTKMASFVHFFIMTMKLISSCSCRVYWKTSHTHGTPESSALSSCLRPCCSCRGWRCCGSWASCTTTGQRPWLLTCRARRAPQPSSSVVRCPRAAWSKTARPTSRNRNRKNPFSSR